MLWFLSLSLFLFCSLGQAYSLPKGMSAEDRKIVTQVLGFGSTAKFASNPYPLGGWNGVEMAVTQEFISVEKLKDLGVNGSSQGSLSYTQFSFGKGFYENFDGYFSFTLPRQQSEMQNYSGLLRTVVYDFEDKKYMATVDINGQGSNMGNLFSSDSFGYDLVLSQVNSWWGYYGGIGWLSIKTRFIGNPITASQGLTSNGQTIVDSAEHMRYFAGLMGHYEKYFALMEVQTVYENTWTVKMGYRF